MSIVESWTSLLATAVCTRSTLKSEQSLPGQERTFQLCLQCEKNVEKTCCRRSVGVSSETTGWAGGLIVDHFCKRYQLQSRSASPRPAQGVQRDSTEPDVRSLPIPFAQPTAPLLHHPSHSSVQGLRKSHKPFFLTYYWGNLPSWWAREKELWWNRDCV